MVLLNNESTYALAVTDNDEESLFHWKKENMTKEELNEYEKEVSIIKNTDFIFRNIKERNLSLTDINFDGKTLWLEDNYLGFYKSEIQPTAEEVDTFLNKIRNQMNEKFDGANNRKMNVVLGFLRINAVHKKNNTSGGHSFSIRIARPRFVVNHLRELFIDSPNEVKEDLEKLLSLFVETKVPIVLSGETGSGKTETQKMLIGTVLGKDTPTHQIIVVEDTPDSHIKSLFGDDCVKSWLLDDNFTIEEAVEEGMRNNPDIFMIAEIRGSGAGAALNAAKTGHGMVVTGHSPGALQTPSRLMPLIRENPQYANYSDSLLGQEVAEYFPICIHMVKERYKINGEIQTVRYPSQIAQITGYSVSEGFIGDYLYKREYVYDASLGEYKKEEQINKLSETLKARIAEKQLIHLVPKQFL